MILLTLDSLLLFFIVFFTGVGTTRLLNRFFIFQLSAGFFEIFLLGLLSCFVYFNLLSFFCAIDYKTLLPLLPVSIAGLIPWLREKKNVQQALSNGRSFFTDPFIFITIPMLVLLFIYWIIPPFNSDSGEYHYLAIRWYEQYKVVPGLANVHGRLAFNPANFILSAAFAFSGPARQSLYPLNGVLALLFCSWLIKKIMDNRFNRAFSLVVFACFFLLLRILLVNISSPSSDLLAGILLFYCGFSTYELLITEKNSPADYCLILLFTCFAVTAKLSAIPSLALLVFIYFLLARNKPSTWFFLKGSLLAALLVLPWLTRNIIMSGYLLYPVPGSRLFHFDWSVPQDVIRLDYIYSTFGPRSRYADFASLQKMNAWQLFLTWLQNMYRRLPVSLLLVSAAFLSLFSWSFFLFAERKMQRPVLLLWCIYYGCIWVWLINSPELRFALSYVILCISIPLLEWARYLPAQRRIPPAIISTCLFCAVIYYSWSALHKHYFDHYALSTAWLRPSRDPRYLSNNDSSSFSFVNLGNGIRLYYPDSTHECLNAPGPCMNWRYGEIEMRGNRITDGFRNKKDEVRKFFPFVAIKNK